MPCRLRLVRWSCVWVLWVGAVGRWVVRPHRPPPHAPVTYECFFKAVCYRTASVATHASRSLSQPLPVEHAGSLQSWDGNQDTNPPISPSQWGPRDYAYTVFGATCYVNVLTDSFPPCPGPAPFRSPPCRWYAVNAESTWPDPTLRPTLAETVRHLGALKKEPAAYMRQYRDGRRAQGEQVGRRRGGRRTGACAMSRTCSMHGSSPSAAVQLR